MYGWNQRKANGDLRTRTSFLHSYHCQWLLYHWRRSDRWNNNIQRLESLQSDQFNHAWERGKKRENVIDTPETKIDEGLTNGIEESERNENDPAPEEPSGQDDWYATEGSRAVKLKKKQVPESFQNSNKHQQDLLIWLIMLRARELFLYFPILLKNLKYCVSKRVPLLNILTIIWWKKKKREKWCH